MKNILTIIALLFAASTFALGQNVEVIPMDNNTSDDNFAPTYTNHGRVVYSTTDEGGKGQRIVTMERTSGGWSGSSEARGALNDAIHTGSTALTPDGQFMIFASYDHDVAGSGRTDLYSARKVDGKWREVTNLGPNVNSSFYDSQPTLSADGRTLIFVSDRTSGAGGTDLYVSTWDGRSWSPAKPLGGVNTSSGEMSPSIGPDGKTFYFASDRPGGAGGFDIYAAKLSNGSVGDIKRMTNAINTSANELFYSGLPNSDQALFSRMTSNGDYDNFMAVPNPFPADPVILVEGVVRNATDRSPVGATITITDLASGKKVADLRSDDESGQYYVTLAQGRVYSVTASAPGFMFHSERYEVPPGSKGTTITKDIDLTPIGAGNERLLVFFDYDKTELKNESIPELERVIEFLRENPGIKVRFEGHTDDQGSDDYNDKLSQRRADAVKDYVVTAGVEKTRVSAKGLGKRQPKMQGTTDDARATNRRVEMVIVP
jgi:outer membrane protein OmpA-like peptidoglycan-associated protein